MTRRDTPPSRASYFVLRHTLGTEGRNLWPSKCSVERVDMRRNIGLGLCIGGLLLSGYALYEVASGRIYQAWRGPELDRTLDSLPPQPAPHRTIAYEQG